MRDCFALAGVFGAGASGEETRTDRDEGVVVLTVACFHQSWPCNDNGEGHGPLGTGE